MSDSRPHSRACGIIPHDHGWGCHGNCPTCHGKDAPAPQMVCFDPDDPEVLRKVSAALLGYYGAPNFVDDDAFDGEADAVLSALKAKP